MSARDRYETQEQCPDCGAESVVKWSEEDHPWVREPYFGREVDAVSAPLYAKNTTPPEIWCQDCDCKAVKASSLAG